MVRVFVSDCVEDELQGDEKKHERYTFLGHIGINGGVNAHRGVKQVNMNF